MQRPQRIILVLGIFRSGMSLLTKGLETMGVSSGTFFLPHDALEPRDHCTNIGFHDFNLSLLNSLEGRKRLILALSEEEVTLLCKKGFFSQAKDLLLDTISTSNLLTIQDPMFSIVWPFWKKVFDACNIEASFLMTLRDPASVVTSIIDSKRHTRKEDPAKFFWTWISYILNFLDYSKGHERILINYNELLKNPEHQMQRIAQQWNLTLDQEKLKTYSRFFIDSSLCHFQKDQTSCLAEDFYKKFAIQIYQALLAVAQDTSSFEEIDTRVSKWHKEFARVYSLLVLAEKHEWTIDALERKILERHNLLDELQEKISETTRSTISLSKILDDHNLQVASLINEQKKHNDEIFQLTKQLERRGRC